MVEIYPLAKYRRQAKRRMNVCVSKSTVNEIGGFGIGLTGSIC